MTEEEINELKREKERENYRVCNFIYQMKNELNHIKKHKGRTTAFKLLHNALDNFEDQVNRDHSRWVSRINARQYSSDNKVLQQSLNRERKLREELQSKIKEASESSGLFISYVRSKLKI